MAMQRRGQHERPLGRDDHPATPSNHHALGDHCQERFSFASPVGRLPAAPIGNPCYTPRAALHVDGLAQSRLSTVSKRACFARADIKRQLRS
jgi:hypothetical protein